MFFIGGLRRRFFLGIVLTGGALFFFSPGRIRGDEFNLQETRQQALKLRQDDNHLEAYQLFRQLVLRPSNASHAPTDLVHAVGCLNDLGRTAEIDELLESVLLAHPNQWRLSHAVAQQFLTIPHHGHLVADKFERGPHRGGGNYVSAVERDRVRALQLLARSFPLVEADDNRVDVANFYGTLSRTLLSVHGQQVSWRLQVLTNLDILPDYDKQHYFTPPSLAPVDNDGQPVFHTSVDRWETAVTDGQRWRWALDQIAANNPRDQKQVLRQLAAFYRHQFGVQTLTNWQHLFSDQGKEKEEDHRGNIFSLHTLKDDETLAQLANGVQRFKLPDEFNHIKIYKRILSEFDAKSWDDMQALAEIYENRRQLPQAAKYWKMLTSHTNRNMRKHAQERWGQIVNNWGKFEQRGSQPAGERATVDFIFRNATQLQLTAKQLNIDQLLQDVKSYIRSKPKRLDHRKIDIANIGHRMIQRNETKYVGKEVAAWNVNLEPRPHHEDRRITIQTPLRKAGVYLVTAKLNDGNTSNIVLWVTDTAIVRKQLSGQTLYFVADAVSGEPIANANVEFFGYRQERVTGKRYRITTGNFAESTNRNGQVIPDPRDLKEELQWVAIARTNQGRLAYLGFEGVWRGQYHDADYAATKAFVITDRPVYRPDQKVHFKLWVRHAQYDMDDVSQLAGKVFEVTVRNPKGINVLKRKFTTDEYGGIVGEYNLPVDATLGVYHFSLVGEHRHGIQAGQTFRVEEYKKPEFEVSIDTSTQPVMLGETITAQIKADYFFGSPVVNARVKYTVKRTNHSDTWFPMAPWDWCFEPGYWWFGYDYPWYPGWSQWVGCVRPLPWWWHRPSQPPEIVAEQQVDIGPDGTVNIAIDTSTAKLAHPHLDHEYTITAEVTDESRRTIVGTGKVLVARKPFRVFTWVDRGYYHVGDNIVANFMAQTLDQQPVSGDAELTLNFVSYNAKREPIETPVRRWQLNVGEDGRARQSLRASQPGQYRLSLSLTDESGHTIEGGYLFTITGEGFDGKDFRFNQIELIPDKREYAPGDTVRLQINTDRAGSTVLLFLRPANGVYLPPKVLRLEGKSTIEDITVVKRDMPNFYVEAMTVSNGQLHSEIKEIIVPPEKRVVNVEVASPTDTLRPGEEASLQLRLTDFQGNPIVGSTVVSIYDKSLEYISGGSNIGDIREFFWKWRRQHQISSTNNLSKIVYNYPPPNQPTWQPIGTFGAPQHRRMGMFGRGTTNHHGLFGVEARTRFKRPAGLTLEGFAVDAAADSEVAAPSAALAATSISRADSGNTTSAISAIPNALAEPSVRSLFADTALWKGKLETNNLGVAEVSLTMPENLTTWKVGVWSMSHGTKVGMGSTELITRKDLIVRMQAPRFFIEKDEVVLSANVHNYLENEKLVTVTLELPGEELESIDERIQQVTIAAGDEQRVDWRIRVIQEGQAVVRMLAQTDEESDAVEMKFPSYVHGMLKTESWAGTIRPEEERGQLAIHVPEERRMEQSRLEIRFSPTLAGAMVDALPYLADYPYGCTEQTLNRFLPSVITQQVLREMQLDPAAIREKRTNLNAQELGDHLTRAKGWKRFPENPVFDDEELQRMVKEGVKRLTEMQNSDGGWGWFSGDEERSWPHTTAVVVHGLWMAQKNGVTLVPHVQEQGIAWLERYQQQQLKLMTNWNQDNKQPKKRYADNLDAMVYMVLAESDRQDSTMREYLYRDRSQLTVYSKAMFGLALHRQHHFRQRDMILRNINQYLVVDEENETAYLQLPPHTNWWFWYGNEVEANAYYLKLLAAVDPDGPIGPRLVKYLLNNRKHATYWSSTRDTALCVEAFADYLRAADELQPDMVLHLSVDGEHRKSVKITAENLFTFDNRFVLTGKDVTSGSHHIELRRDGKGPVYFNAYLTNFTLEDYITRAGLEIKVDRKYYKLERTDTTTDVPGSRGQAIQQRVEKYERHELKDLSTLKSGDLVEVELEMISKNDYEYILFEDMKPAGFETIDVRSGYTHNGLSAYRELRDNRVAFFLHRLPRGRHSVNYRMRAEIPGRFSALPVRAYAMYAPELRGNSDEIKLHVED